MEVVEGLDLGKFERQYRGRGTAAYYPAILLSLLVYGYATGVFSRCKNERATNDSVAFRFISAGQHPDHDTLASFRRRFLGELKAVFVQVLQLAHEMKLLKLGTISLDGTKILANGSRHRALSYYAHAEKIEAQLKGEVQELLALAEQVDQSAVPEGMDLPEELKRREERLAGIAQAKAKIEARAKARFEHEQAEYQTKCAQREAQQKASGKKPRGKLPKPPAAGPRPQDQINLTDEDSRIMPVAGVGFEQAYNAQAAVDAATMLVVVSALTQAPNDKEQVAPTLGALQQLPPELGQAKQLLADTGYSSEHNLERCEAIGEEPFIAQGREAHHPGWRGRFEEPEPLPAAATARQRAAYRLKTKAGRAAYALRKRTIEPVFGIIKSVMGFRQFMLRLLDKVTGECRFVGLAWNLKRMAALRPT